jgi:leucyl/phenylalanyl-tRNA---protein transferase
MTIPWLDAHAPFPPVETALREPNGLLAAGADLSPERLISAYTQGIFPWFGEGEPILWWSPDPRMVLWLSELHVSRSLRRTLKSAQYTVTLDSAFGQVIAGCAEPRDADGTWITPEMIDAYGRLASLGYAHSVEVWADEQLVGGLYGIAIGRVFCGESMFSRLTDTSKIALVYLVRQLQRWQFELIDCQMFTGHLASLGAREIARAEFRQHLERLTRMPGVASPWVLQPGLGDTLE